MFYALLADLVLLIHLAFVLFVLFAGAALVRWPRLAWAHVPAFLWGALVELMGWPCPLTPLENFLRRQAGDTGYSGGFVEHYLLVLIYPQGLTRPTQLLLGAGVVVINALWYARWYRHTRR